MRYTPLNLMDSFWMESWSAFQTSNSPTSSTLKRKTNKSTQTLISSHHQAINIQNKASSWNSPAMMMKQLFQIHLERKTEDRWEDTTPKYSITIFRILFSLTPTPSKLWSKLKREKRLLLFNAISWRTFQKSLCFQEKNR